MSEIVDDAKAVLRTWNSWRMMRERCTNPKHDAFKHYGGRGILVCERWMLSFDHFLEDMGKRPADKTLDRRNVNGNYELGNCRWATKIEQGANQRTNRLLTVNGEKITLAESARRLGVNPRIIHNRLTLGWDEQRAATMPVNSNRTEAAHACWKVRHANMRAAR